MTITDSLIKISDWLNREVCSCFMFKNEPPQGQPITDQYEYKEVNPQAFPFMVPARDKLPPNITVNMPSVCVQIVDGSDEVARGKRDININLGIATWNPGVHSKDIYYPKGTEPDEPEKYRSGYDGWMDTWNFIDATIRKLESITKIDNLYLAPDIPIRFGPYKEQDTIPDFYPHWFGYIQFTVRSDFIRNNKEIEDLL